MLFYKKTSARKSLIVLQSIAKSSLLDYLIVVVLKNASSDIMVLYKKVHWYSIKKILSVSLRRPNSFKPSSFWRWLIVF